VANDNQRTFAIVGASLAGAKAAETLRDEGFDGRVVLLGEEPVRPYERPPLSKDYLRGESGTDKVFVHDADYYESNNIELRLSTRVIGVESRNRAIVLDSGEQLTYDSLLLATGAQPRLLTVPGSHLKGVHYLRSMADSDRLRFAIASATRVVVIGGGWIGCEVAASARQMGSEVSMVEVGNLPLERVLGPELGAFYRDVHADNGVDLHLGAGVAELRGKDEVEDVVLSDGKVLTADVVVVGVGVSPRVDIAESAGLALDNGVLTNEWLSASEPNIFAAGDVANAWHPVLERRVRLEHWSSALNQGPVAARNMMGLKTAYERIPYFFSDQYDVSMEYSGLAVDWDEVVIRGEVATREFIAFWIKDGRLAAGMNVNVWDVAGDIAKLVAAKVPVEPGQLRDPDVQLSSLVDTSGGPK